MNRRFWLGGAIVVLGVVILTSVFWPGWPDRTTEQWSSISALASVVTATLAGLSLLGLAYLGQQVRAQQVQLTNERNRFHAEFSPYLRVDLSPVGQGGTWNPPPAAAVRNQLTFEDVNPGLQLDLGAFAAWPGNVEVSLWLWNTQTQAAGLADNIRVQLEFEVPDPDGGEHIRQAYEFTLAYLEPNQRIQYRIASVSNRIPFLNGRVTDIRYYGIYGEQLRWGHGSAGFHWVNPTLVNDRYTYREAEAL